MDDMRWAWVLFVAASLAVLIRLGMWFWPSTLRRYSEQVSAVAEDPASLEPDQASEEAPPPAEKAWPDEAVERTDWLPPMEPIRLEPEPELAEPLPPPEEFHFRRTRWGMTIDEVRAAEPGEPLRESERGLMYAVHTLELPSLLTYSFARGGLVRARLSFSDPAGRDIPPLSVAQAQRRFLYLREQLRSRYGEPVEATTHLPRDVSDLRRREQKQGELAKQYDVEIAEAEQRLKTQREVLETRFERWLNRGELVARGLAPLERDLRDLRTWKQEAIELASKSRQRIQDHQAADAARPLVATMTARWPHARNLHDIEIKLDFRFSQPRLDIRYEGIRTLAELWQMDEL